MPFSETTPRTDDAPGTRSGPERATTNSSPHTERALPYSSRATIEKDAGLPATEVRSPAPRADEARAFVRAASTVAWKGEPMMLTPPSCARTK